MGLNRKEKLQVLLFLVVFGIAWYYGAKLDTEYIQAGLIPW